MKPLHITIIRYSEQDDSNKPKSIRNKSNRNESKQIKFYCKYITETNRSYGRIIIKCT